VREYGIVQTRYSSCSYKQYDSPVTVGCFQVVVAQALRPFQLQMALSLTGFFDGRQERLSEQGLSALTLSKAHAAKGTSQGGSKGEAS
jgi:hypothetical protein